MVTAIAKPFAAPVPNVVESIPRESSNGAVAERRTVCPRCESRLRTSYFEPECIQCGYADYSYRPVNGVKKGIINSGTRYVIRYVESFHPVKHVGPYQAAEGTQPGGLRGQMPILRHGHGADVSLRQA